jgi:CRP/FNR family transcriptional regulator, cyclic AMP receptor protein
LYYVIKGKVRAYKSNEDGKELVTDLFCPGDFIGYIALLEGAPYKDTTKAMEETELAIIPAEDFNELLNNNKEVTQKFIRLLAKNVSEKEEQLLGIAFNSLRKKVAVAILTMQHKYQQSNEQDFNINISRESLAAIAGTAKESLIRTLSDFRTEKMIEINKDGSITITNQKKLEHLLN